MKTTLFLLLSMYAFSALALSKKEKECADISTQEYHAFKKAKLAFVKQLNQYKQNTIRLPRDKVQEKKLMKDEEKQMDLDSQLITFNENKLNPCEMKEILLPQLRDLTDYYNLRGKELQKINSEHFEE